MFAFFKFFNPKKIFVTQSIISKKLIFWAIFVFVLHIFIISKYEAISLFDSFWYTTTAALTVGFGDIAPKTVEGRMATVILIYGGLIFTVAKIANDFFSLMAIRQENKLKGKWNYNMENHIVIIGHPINKPENYLHALISQIKADNHFANRNILLVSDTFDELHKKIADLGVAWVKGDKNDQYTLDMAGVSDAQAVIILAKDEGCTVSDSITLDVVVSIRKSNPNAYIICETVNSYNENKFIQAGASATVAVMHGYPNILSRALTVKGCEKVISNIFSDDNQECVKAVFDKPKTYSWSNLVIEFMTKDLGTPIALVDKEGNTHTSPLGKTFEVKEVFFISVRELDNKTIYLT